MDNVKVVTPFDCHTAYFHVHFKVTNRDNGNTNLAANANVVTAGLAFTLKKSLKVDFKGLSLNKTMI